MFNKQLAMKKFKYSLLLSFFALLAFTQAALGQGVLKFTEETHDFGTIEEGAISEHQFEFTNTGTEPILIKTVQASCGCTTPDWTREAILPNQKGVIKARFDSRGRPGNFFKTITVTSNASEPSKRLNIKGNVVRDPSKDAKIVLDKTVFKLGKVQKGKEMTFKIPYKNLGKMDLMLTEVSSPCNCVKRVGYINPITPNGQGILEIAYTPSKVGKITEKIMLKTNSLTTPAVEIIVESESVENLSGASPLRTNGVDF
ncbi:MAG: DUF1573 domain-containing protein [Cytophagales bacterium]|nr:MAG: DUF1573 domain-containing protein [Cytophagales bacterium]TAF60400.1 MAG: DUF1573 domain-containing protein [Cytophagales bacterium]